MINRAKKFITYLQENKEVNRVITKDEMTLNYRVIITDEKMEKLKQFGINNDVDLHEMVGYLKPYGFISEFVDTGNDKILTIVSINIEEYLGK